MSVCKTVPDMGDHGVSVSGTFTTHGADVSSRTGR